MKVIIVGGVAGGATAAARIRRMDEHAEITVFERSGYISYVIFRLPRSPWQSVTACPARSTTEASSVKSGE